MTQKQKQLLLQDLCARLPYEVKGRVYAETTKGEYDINGDMIFYDSPFDVTFDAVNTSTEEIHVIAIGNEDTVDFIEEQQTDGKPYTVDEFKPYLRPMSSMTEEEREELFQIWKLGKENGSESVTKLLKEIFYKAINENYILKLATSFENWIDVMTWFNKHHFDYHGLIEKGLAIEAPKDMYKI